MVNYQYFLFLSIIGLLVLFSGCVDNKEVSVPAGQVSPTPIESPVHTIPASSPQTLQSEEQNKINELENKINSMQLQITDLQTRLDMVGLSETK